MDQIRLTHLRQLEAESIHIIRRRGGGMNLKSGDALLYR